MPENALPDVRRDADKVRITPLEADIPDGVEELARKAYAKVRPIKITQLLVEIDQVTHFSRHCTHLHRGDPARDREALFAAMLAEATNLGLSKMASATPGMTITAEQLAHLSYGLGAYQPDWGLYLGFDREESTRSPGLAYSFPGCSLPFHS